VDPFRNAMPGSGPQATEMWRYCALHKKHLNPTYKYLYKPRNDD